MWSKTPLLSIALAAGPSFVLSAAISNTTGSTIQWGTCNFNVTAPIVCGNLPVPLDYTDPKASNSLNLELVKIPAPKTPSKGSILFNFGGPGYEARRTLVALSARLLQSTGGYYNLIAFDPRGTANTIPFSCYTTDTNRTMAFLQSPILANASDTALGQLWAQGEILADKCLANANATGSMIGTPFVARDLMQVVDALHEDGLLRYYGISYGTVLGATVAAMFPDRMDKVLLDGVVNIQEYYHGDIGDGFETTDAVFSNLLKACVVAGKDKCALAALNMTADELEKSMYGLLDTLKYHPIVLPNLLVVVGYAIVKGYIVSELYSPKAWPDLAKLLAALYTRDLLAIEQLILQLIAAQSGPDAITVTFEATTGIRCADNTIRTTNMADLQPFIDRWYATSRLAGDQLPGTLYTCAQWKIPTKEPYTGSFVAPNSLKTRKPLMLIGNTYDPVTALVQAKNLSAVFQDSVVLTQNGYGHASIAQPSNCTDQAIAAYFNDGKLPDPGTICEVDTKLFEGNTGSASVPGGGTTRRNLKLRQIYG